MIIPYEKLSQRALQGLIEEFVNRDGTDSGYTQKSLEGNKDSNPVRTFLVRASAA
jgi:uncharacterized protein